MSESYEVEKANKVRQLREKAAYDKETVHTVLDQALVASVGFVQDGAPIVVPMIYGRDDDTLYLHGARKARVIRLLEQTERACVNVTLLDGIVYARSTFNSSMNYRSATVFGRPELIEGHDEKLRARRAIGEHTLALHEAPRHCAVEDKLLAPVVGQREDAHLDRQLERRRRDGEIPGTGCFGRGMVRGGLPARQPAWLASRILAACVWVWPVSGSHAPHDHA